MFQTPVNILSRTLFVVLAFLPTLTIFAQLPTLIAPHVNEFSPDVVDDYDGSEELILGGKMLSNDSIRVAGNTAPSESSRLHWPVAVPKQLPVDDYQEMRFDNKKNSGNGGNSENNNDGDGWEDEKPPRPRKKQPKRLPNPDNGAFAPRTLESEETLYESGAYDDVDAEDWDPSGEIPRDMPEHQFLANEFIPVEGGVYDESTLRAMSLAGYTGIDDFEVPSVPGIYDGCDGAPVVAAHAPSLLDNLSINLGVTGFKNQLDRGRDGNFGFVEGFNWSTPITPLSTVMGQFGFRSTQTALTGSADERNHRTQYYITAGIFRRNLCSPFQGGVAYDWYQDNHAGKVKLEQLRMELSYRTMGQYEYGFLGGFGLNKARNEWIDTHFVDDARAPYLAAGCYYTFFVRKNFLSGGIGLLNLGMSEYGDTIFGGKFELPINDRLEMNTAFTMMIPGEGNAHGGREKESWSLGIEFIYRFRGGALCKQHNPCRPMFDVADNGTLLPRVGR